MVSQMLGFLKALTFPVTGPFIGTRWIAGVLLEEAERQLYDADGIRQQMAEVERQFQMRQIDGETFERRQEELLARLLEARDYYRRKNGEVADVALPAPPTARRSTGGPPTRKRRTRHG
jgi:hypothetical protein